MNVEPESGYEAQTETGQISRQVGTAFIGVAPLMILTICGFADDFWIRSRTLCSRRYPQPFYGELDEEHGILGKSCQGHQEDEPSELTQSTISRLASSNSSAMAHSAKRTLISYLYVGREQFDLYISSVIETPRRSDYTA